MIIMDVLVPPGLMKNFFSPTKINEVELVIGYKTEHGMAMRQDIFDARKVFQAITLLCIQFI